MPIFSSVRRTGKVELLDELDDLKLLGGRVPHVTSRYAVTLFLRGDFQVSARPRPPSAALASRRRSLTSSEVAARAVSPASRFFPASRKYFRLAVIEVRAVTSDGRARDTAGARPASRRGRGRADT